MSQKRRSRPTTPAATEPIAVRRRWLAWVAVIAPLAVLVALTTANSLSGPPDGDAVDTVPDFVLATTTGETLDRTGALAGNETLFYFSMGIGCDGCFAQIPEIAPGLDQRGIRLVPVMVDPQLIVASEATRWGIDMPIVIDDDLELSRAMGMLGVYGHSNSPSHSFALADGDGNVRWVRHYAEMFVPAELFFAELDAA
ncbi:MAG TPA: redoxin family protein [Acidimicrobiia bacterium]|nr:redoxin family protein [Acidimicrobiia bacterium]